MRRCLYAGLIVVLGMAMVGYGETGDVENAAVKLVGQIDSENAETAAAAAKGISELPASALSVLYAHAEEDKLSVAGQKRLDDAIAALEQHAVTERIKKNKEVTKQWQYATGVEAYKAVGKHDAKWDKEALAALTSNAEGHTEDSFTLFKAAVDAGCNDPLILYYYGFKGRRNNQLSDSESMEAMRKSLEEMSTSDYSPQRKLLALARFAMLRLGDEKISDNDAALIRSNLDRSLEFLRQMPKEGDYEEDLLDIGTGLVKAYSWALKDKQAAFDKVFKAMRETYPQSAIPLAFAARWHTKWAWEARGSGFANTVKDEAWKLFRSRLETAKDYATQAWKLDQMDQWGPTEMITICMGLNEERPMMEQWFTRAMRANPDNKIACSQKMQYLMPKWHGSMEDMVAFGRQCAEQGNGRNQIALQLVDAYIDVAEYNWKWLSNPVIWQDFKDCFEKALEDKTRLQNDRHEYLKERGAYLRWAFELQKWDDAMRLSKEFGDEIDMKAFGNKALYHYYMRKAAKEMAKEPI